ncbi:MAG: hypothetical protein A2X49_14070 [Lentisphaerae bacterium GWF2_52_8]|nr:MAG: hypothetical protein A2X49_14070 [Lentisphaerae bacterium GWF2_52_8]
MKILIVDDDFATRKILSMMLKKYGEISIAENGQIALSALGNSLRNDTPYDLICMDISMPEMGGLETLRAIRKIEDAAGFPEGAGAKVIITTANSESSTIMEAFREHCDAYLVKPVKVPELQQTLSSLRLVPKTNSAC